MYDVVDDIRSRAQDNAWATVEENPNEVLRYVIVQVALDALMSATNVGFRDAAALKRADAILAVYADHVEKATKRNGSDSYGIKDSIVRAYAKLTAGNSRGRGRALSAKSVDVDTTLLAIKTVRDAVNQFKTDRRNWDRAWVESVGEALNVRDIIDREHPSAQVVAELKRKVYGL